jgi:RHS repeat-associated protein
MTDTPATPATAKTVWRASHEPFGLATVQTDPDGDSVHIALDLRFPGQVYDAESGLHQNLFRTYDPDVASYLESDPIGYSTHAHAYNYADNQPMKWIDPTGLIRLPGDPSGLPDEWTRDPTHRDPNGERWRHPSGDFLDFHRGRPGMPGNRGKDHWHHKDDAEHLPPGSDVPDSSESPDGSSSPCGGECQKKLVMVVGASGSIYLTYRCIRLVPSMFPPLWWTIPSNLVVP